MVTVNGENLLERCDVKAEAMKKLSKDRSFRNIEEKHNVRYRPEQYYPHHVLMVSDFGTRRCFKYSEVLWKMY